MGMENVHDTIKKHEPISTKQIAKILGITDSAVGKNISRLKARNDVIIKGTIKQKGGGAITNLWGIRHD